jgi:opacity protein-like surface antigen
MNRLAVTLLAGIAAFGVASVTYAADLIIDTPNEPGIVEASGDWDGVYIGVFGGYAAGSATSPVDFDLNGWLVGVNAGANFTLTDGIVAGIVGDIAWSGITDDEVFVPPGGFDVNWAGSVRGRIGFDGGAFLPYVTAGLAFANATLTAGNGVEVGTNTHIGWTAGVGVEFKATDDLSVDLAYRYSDYGAQAYGVSDFEFTTHQVTAGLNWHF